MNLMKRERTPTAPLNIPSASMSRAVSATWNVCCSILISPPLKGGDMSTHPGLLTTSLIVGWLLLSGPLTASGQIVRVPGVTGTLALPESVDKFYADVNKILVKTSDAV